MYPEEELYQGILAGPSEEDRQYAQGIGALTAGLGILRNKRDIPGALLGGLASYQGTLDAADKATKNRLTSAAAAKKLVQDRLRTQGYSDFFTEDGVDLLGLAKAAARNGDSNTLSQALALHEKQGGKKPDFIPGVPGYRYENGKAVKIEGVPDATAKMSPQGRRIQELMDQGHPYPIAEAMVYRPYMLITAPDGTITMTDTRQIPGQMPSQAPSGSGPGMVVAPPGTSVPSPGASAAPGGVSPAPGVPAAGPALGPGAVTPRFAPSPTPPGAVFSLPGRKMTKELDDAVQHFQAAYTKTGVGQVEDIFNELDAELAKYGYKYDPNADPDPKTGKGRGAYVVADPSQKTKDIPGMGMTGNMPQWMLSDPGRAISGPVQALINQRLYDLSGKAVTKNEMERQLRALQATAFLGDKDTLRGLGRVRRGYEITRDQIMSGANPDVLTEYQRRKALIQKPPAAADEGAITVDPFGFEVDKDGKKTGRRFNVQTGEQIQ